MMHNFQNGVCVDCGAFDPSCYFGFDILSQYADPMDALQEAFEEHPNLERVVENMQLIQSVSVINSEAIRRGAPFDIENAVDSEGNLLEGKFQAYIGRDGRARIINQG